MVLKETLYMWIRIRGIKRQEEGNQISIRSFISVCCWYWVKRTRVWIFSSFVRTRGSRVVVEEVSWIISVMSTIDGRMVLVNIWLIFRVWAQWSSIFVSIVFIFVSKLWLKFIIISFKSEISSLAEENCGDEAELETVFWNVLFKSVSKSWRFSFSLDINGSKWVDSLSWGVTWMVCCGDDIKWFNRCFSSMIKEESLDIDSKSGLSSLFVTRADDIDEVFGFAASPSLLCAVPVVLFCFLKVFIRRTSSCCKLPETWRKKLMNRIDE